MKLNKLFFSNNSKNSIVCFVQTIQILSLKRFDNFQKVVKSKLGFKAN